MDFASLLLPVLLIAVFYFLLIRPQQKQRRQMAQLQQSIVPGTRVMTGAGLLGTVVSIDDDEVELEVAPGVTNRYVRRAIVNVVDKPAEPDVAPIHDDDPSDASELPTEDRTNGDDKR